MGPLHMWGPPMESYADRQVGGMDKEGRGGLLEGQGAS